MILHALHIIANELNLHFSNVLTDNLPGGPTPQQEDKVELGSIALIENNGGVVQENLQDRIIASVVNICEEKTLRNTPFHKTDAARLRTDYFNPPVFMNVYVLFSATSKNYEKAISEVSRVIRFFQFRHVFTHENTNQTGLIIPLYDRMTEFKIIMDLCSPNFEELNHLWGTLGGRQYPSVLYQMRLLEMRHTDLPTSGGGVIQEIERHYRGLTGFPEVQPS